MDQETRTRLDEAWVQARQEEAAARLLRERRRHIALALLPWLIMGLLVLAEKFLAR